MSHCHTIISSLRQRGYRITPQREMIIEIIAHTECHMSAEEVYEEVEKRTQTVNLATVYRTLDFLWREGFARRNVLSDGKTMYATSQHGPHIHLICRKCNCVIDADPSILGQTGERIRTEYAFEADLHHLSIFGCCADCADEE